MWVRNFSPLFNVYNVSAVRQIGIHAAELLTAPIHIEVEIAIAKLRK
jgi:hypothetical protein